MFANLFTLKNSLQLATVRSNRFAVFVKFFFSVSYTKSAFLSYVKIMLCDISF